MGYKKKGVAEKIRDKERIFDYESFLGFNVKEFKS